MIDKQELFDYEEFVPYEEALELKKLGFNKPCFGWFASDKSLVKEITTKTDFTLAPTYSQAFRWFRKNHDLVHRIDRDGGWWLCSILNLYDEEDQGAIETHIDNCYPDSYEESELACLKELIKIVKNG